MKEINDIRIPNQNCPKCGYFMDATSSPFNEGSKPSAGDVSICLACGAASIFNSDNTLRLPTEIEAEEILHNPQVLQAQLARASVVGDKIKERMANESAK